MTTELPSKASPDQHIPGTRTRTTQPTLGDALRSDPELIEHVTRPDRSGLSVAEAAFLAEHSGFVPQRHPTELGPLLGLSEGFVHQGREFTLMEVHAGARPLYHHEMPKEQADISQAIAGMGVYNTVVDSNGSRGNVDIHSEVATAVHDRARETLANGQFTVILPFANEAGTIGKAMRHSASRVGKDNIIAIDAETDPLASSEAQATSEELGDADVVKQSDVLSGIDWDLLRREGIVPPDFQPKGAKGLTMYAGVIAAQALGQLDGKTVIFHDTDITNPGSEDAQRSESGSYGALEHLAIPYTYPLDSGTIHSTMIARTGTGRNNEPWLYQANMIAAMSHLPKMQRLAVLLGSLEWPLSGERTIGGNITSHDGSIKPLIHELAFPVGMGVETYMNIALAGIDAKTGRRSVFQVANPNPKLENRESPRDREYGLIFGCAKNLNFLARHVEETGKHVIDWDIDDIASFNQKHGGRRDMLSVPSPIDHQPNRVVSSGVDVLLPSISMLESLGAVNWDKVKGAIRPN